MTSQPASSDSAGTGDQRPAASAGGTPPAPPTGPMPVWPQEPAAPNGPGAGSAAAGPSGATASDGDAAPPSAAPAYHEPPTTAPAYAEPTSGGPVAAPPGTPVAVAAPDGGMTVTQTIPVAADHAPGVPRRDAVLGMMGRPAQPQPPKLARRTGTPRMRALALAAVWALVLCLGGLACGVWGLIAILGGLAAGWYEPTIVVVGVFGLALAAAAFPLAERRLLPWALLAGSTVTLIAGFVVTGSAT